MALAPGDEMLVPVFKNMPVFRKADSDEKGRPIYDTQEVVEIRFPGDRNKVSVFPAHAQGSLVDLPDGSTRKLTYAERFPDQYEQFKKDKKQAMFGTPLDVFLEVGQVATLNGLNIYTAEQLAAVDGVALKALGQDGRVLKNQAYDYLQRSAHGGEDVEALKARIAELEAVAKGSDPVGGGGDDKPSVFDKFDDKDIRDWIKDTGGETVHPNTGRAKLIAKAEEVNAGLPDDQKVKA